MINVQSSLKNQFKTLGVFVNPIELGLRKTDVFLPNTIQTSQHRQTNKQFYYRFDELQRVKNIQSNDKQNR